MDTERYVQKFVTTFRMVFVHQMLKSALIYCDCNGDPLGPRDPLAGLPAVYALTPQLGSDSVLKHRIVQKFDIHSDGFPIETACNPPFK